MGILDAEILREATRLSTEALGFVLFVGGLLWLFGWRWHRFWVVMTITIAGGLAGLRTGQMVGGHMLVFGLLLALSAGLLALELAKLLSFLIGGLVCGLAVQSIFPDGQERWLAFLIGGLVSVLLYRLGTMAISSLAGGTLAIYAASAYYLKASADLDGWVERNRVLFNVLAVGLTLLGILAQAMLERFMRGWDKVRKERKEQKIRDDERTRVLAAMPVEDDTKKILKHLTGSSKD